MATLADLQEAMATVQRACQQLNVDWEPVWRDLQKTLRIGVVEVGIFRDRLEALKLQKPQTVLKKSKPQRRQFFDARTHEFGIRSHKLPRFKPGGRVRGGSQQYRRRVW